MALGGVSVEVMDLVMGQRSSPGHDLPLNLHVCSSEHLSGDGRPPDPREQQLADEMGLWWAWESLWTS